MFKEHIEMLTAIINKEQFDSLKFKRFISLFFPEDVDKVTVVFAPSTFQRMVDVCLHWDSTFYGRDVYSELNLNNTTSVHTAIKRSTAFQEMIPTGYVIAEFGSKKYELIPIEEAHQINYYSLLGYPGAYIHSSDVCRLETFSNRTDTSYLRHLSFYYNNDFVDYYIIEMLPEEFPQSFVTNHQGETILHKEFPYCKTSIIKTLDGVCFIDKPTALYNGYIDCYLFDSEEGVLNDTVEKVYSKPIYPGVYQLITGQYVYISEEGVTPSVGLTVSGERFYYAESLLRQSFPSGFCTDDSGLKRQLPIYLMNYDSFTHPDHSEASAYKFGVEIEKEDIDVRNSIDVSAFIENTGGWVKEKDGSLDGEAGYELISPIYDLMNLSRFKDDIKNPLLVKHINAEYTSNCGGHITISSNEMDSLELYSGLKSFFPLLYSLYPSRTTKSYSKATCLFHGGYSSSRNSGIYRKNDDLLEMRIFPAIRNTENLLWRIKLIQIMLKHIGSGETSILKMLLNKRSELNIHIRTMYKRSGTQVEQRLLNLATRYVNNVKEYNHVVLDASVLNGLKIKSRK